MMDELIPLLQQHRVVLVPMSQALFLLLRSQGDITADQAALAHAVTDHVRATCESPHADGEQEGAVAP